MMKKKYLPLLLAVSSIFLLFLSACSSNKGGNTNGSSSEVQKTKEGIYEHLKNAKNEIWYVTKEVSKTSYPSYIYIFNKGEVKGYNLFDANIEGKSFGDLAQMSDKEIIDYYESQEGAALKGLSEQADSFYANINQNEVSKATSEAYKKYADGKGELPAVKYKVKLVTDESGTGVESENIDINLLGVGQHASRVGEFPHYTAVLKHVTSTTKVFDSTYNGFETEDAAKPLFVTRSKKQFDLDTTKTNAKGLEIE